MDLFAKQGARGHQRQPQMQQNPFGSMFNQGPALMPPPPQMMFMRPPPPPMFMNPQYRPPGFQPGPPGFMPPQQVGFQQPPMQNFGMNNNVYRPAAPMPGPTFIPNNRPPPNFAQPNGFMQPPQGFGFQPQQQQGFGFQPQQQQGFGFQIPQINIQPQMGFQSSNMGINFSLGFWLLISTSYFYTYPV